MQKLWFVVFTAIGFVSVADCVVQSEAANPSAHLIKVNKTIIESQPLAVSIENSIQTAYQQMRSKNLRKFPYPYNAMLALSSDIDDTTPAEFSEYHRFLNTKQQTPNGPGLGLDVGDSFWVYMANNQPNITDKEGRGLEEVMTYFTGVNPTQPHDASMIKHYWTSGWIDTIHTFGDFSRKNTTDVVFTRSLAMDAWHALNQAGIHPSVWINHGNEANVQDFGGYGVSNFFRYQKGEVPT
ncbi:MAG: hypothetical protein JWN30_2184, partial [Bacilli bacterium]|nr:hypothetical protein [Bacilli bacterium]